MNKPSHRSSQSTSPAVKNFVLLLAILLVAFACIPAAAQKDSGSIAGVVKDIRKQGFDVLLMLEATIGLNELEQQPVAALEASNAEKQSGDKTFTAQDLSFLKSLRIAIEEHEGHK